MGGSTDEWQRPPRDGVVDVVADGVVDVPLTSTGPEPDTVPGDRPSAPNWRRSIGVALAGGLLAGIVLSVVILNDDGPSADDEPATTVAPDELASRITTPPTLAPLTPLPPPDDPALVRSGDEPAPTVTPTRTRSGAVPTVPRYPDVIVMTGDDETELAEYDLGAAVGRLGDDVARRSTTHVELGASGFVLDVTITRDPERDRYEIVVESGGASQIAIVDVASGTTFSNVGSGERQEIPNRDIIAGSDAETINEFFDRLLLGPLRPDTLAEASVDPGFLVTIGGVGVARRFDTTLAGALVPEWQLYAFSPVFEFPVEDRPSTLDYAVYVDQGGHVARIDGVSLVGDVPQLVQHRIELLDPPDPIVIVGPDGEVTGDDLVATPTTSPTTSPATSPVTSP